jgi:hypothetical protein
MKQGEETTKSMEDDAMRCHEDYIRRTSKHPKRDIHTFRSWVRFIRRLRARYGPRKLD